MINKLLNYFTSKFYKPFLNRFLKTFFS